VQLERPITRKRAPIPSKVLAAGVIRKNGRVLIRQRSANELLGGLWSFPTGQSQARENLAASLGRAINEELGMKIEVGRQVQTVTHTFSHFQLTLQVFDCRWQSGRLPPAATMTCKWVRVSELSDYPMGRPDRQIARWLQDKRL
jgi:A/G-specific adenine glycosylase